MSPLVVDDWFSATLLMRMCRHTPLHYQKNGRGVKRNYKLPVPNNRGKTAVVNLEKAELLVQTFRKVHSLDNLKKEARQCRGSKLIMYYKMLKETEILEESLGLPFNKFELSSCQHSPHHS